MMAVAASGVGHNDGSMFVYFFPLLVLLSLLPGVMYLLGPFTMLLGLLQFPLYAIILGAGIRKQRTKEVVIGLIAFHLLAVMLIIFVID